MEVEGTMDSSEEGSVEPSTALGDEFGDLVGYIGDGVCGLDVV